MISLDEQRQLRALAHTHPAAAGRLLALVDEEWRASSTEERRSLAAAAAGVALPAAGPDVETGVDPDVDTTVVTAAAPVPAPVRPPLDLRPARARIAAERARRTPPEMPGTAWRWAGPGGWRWADIGMGVPGGRAWLKLLAGIADHGRLHSVTLHAAAGLPHGHGRCAIRQTPDGSVRWGVLQVGQGLADREGRRAAAHEIAHLGDEVARLADIGAAAWGGEYAARTAAAERFAESCEEWVTPTSSARELLERARYAQRLDDARAHAQRLVAGGRA